MKLATLKNGTRDGQLVLVSKDLSEYVDASAIAPTLQAALDSWADIAPRLQDLARDVEAGSGPAK
ncbi:MAG: 2-keto-4-pentenoate hydratase, partial [Thalassospira sp.]|nr:2-keto-4-pentenoate hydratase [Thalassospira sp.]